MMLTLHYHHMIFAIVGCLPVCLFAWLLQLVWYITIKHDSFVCCVDVDLIFIFISFIIFALRPKYDGTISWSCHMIMHCKEIAKVFSFAHFSTTFNYSNRPIGIHNSTLILIRNWRTQINLLDSNSYNTIRLKSYSVFSQRILSTLFQIIYFLFSIFYFLFFFFFLSFNS